MVPAGIAAGSASSRVEQGVAARLRVASLAAIKNSNGRMMISGRLAAPAIRQPGVCRVERMSSISCRLKRPLKRSSAIRAEAAPEGNEEATQPGPGSASRRALLLAPNTALLLSALSNAGYAQAETELAYPAINMRDCKNPNPPVPAGLDPHGVGKSCPNPPTGSSWPELSPYKLPDNLDVHLRPAWTTAWKDPKYKEKYVAAYTAMLQLNKKDPDDPRGFDRQFKLHALYCGSPNKGSLLAHPPFEEIHGNYLFAAWHRWFLYFHERILGSLINDPTFRLPYWDWDNFTPFPQEFVTDKDLMALRLDAFNEMKAPANLHTENLSTLVTRLQDKNRFLEPYTTAFQRTEEWWGFLGQPFSDVPLPGIGHLEQKHGDIHQAVGEVITGFGDLQTAAKEPLFYVHHANVDRIWDAWNKIGSQSEFKGGLNPDGTGVKMSDGSAFTTTGAKPNYGASSFTFFDENKSMVAVKVSDCANPRRMGYDYENITNQWYQPPQPPKPTGPKRFPPAFMVQGHVPPTGSVATDAAWSALWFTLLYKALEETRAGPVLKAPGVSGGAQVDVGRNPVSFRVKRNPPKSGFALWGGQEKARPRMEVVVLEGLLLSEAPLSARVFLNKPDATMDTPTDIPEFVGAYNWGATSHHHHGAVVRTREQKTQLRLNIHRQLANLGKTDAETILLTVVPVCFADAWSPCPKGSGRDKMVVKAAESVFV